MILVAFVEQWFFECNIFSAQNLGYAHLRRPFEKCITLTMYEVEALEFFGRMFCRSQYFVRKTLKQNLKLDEI